MTADTHKSNRSTFHRIISCISPCNHARTARLDFWGAVALVCVLGGIIKLVQYVLEVS